MKRVLVLFASAMLLFACTEEVPPVADPCECVDIINGQATNHPTFDSCTHKMQFDAKFSIAFKKCQYAQITGNDTSKVQILEQKKTELELPQDGRYELDLETSEIRFLGKNSLTNSKHTGFFKFTEGFILLQDTMINTAEFQIDINSMTGSRFADDESRLNFQEHLLSPDFFDAAKFPTATIKLISANEHIFTVKTKAEVTVKGVTQEMVINAAMAGSGENELKATGSLLLNRTDFGINYGSGSIFDDLGDNVIDDQVPIVFDLKLKRVE